MAHVIRDRFGTPMTDLGMQIALGMWDGAFKTHKFFAGTVSASETSVTDVCSTSLFQWLEPSSYGAVSITSTSSQDAPGGTGIEQVVLGLVTKDYDLATETVTLNGLGTVTTSGSDYIHVWRMYGEHTDTRPINDTQEKGNIVASIAGANMAIITQGKGQTLHSPFIVPRGYKAYLFKGKAATGVGKQVEGRFSVITTTITDSGTEVYSPKRGQHEFLALENAYEYKFDVPGDIPERSRLEVIGKTTTGTARVTGAYDIVLVPQPFNVST